MQALPFAEDIVCIIGNFLPRLLRFEPVRIVSPLWCTCRGVYHWKYKWLPRLPRRLPAAAAGPDGVPIAFPITSAGSSGPSGAPREEPPSTTPAVHLSYINLMESRFVTQVLPDNARRMKQKIDQPPQCTSFRDLMEAVRGIL